MKDNKPVLAIVGYGRAGKDTSCDYLRDNTILRFKGGCSWTAREYMANRLTIDKGYHVSPDMAYACRHANRDKWKQYMDEYRALDPTLLIRNCLIHSDIVCGVRDVVELRAAQNEGLIDLTIWIDKPDVPMDTTVTFTVNDCDIVIRNDGSHDLLYKRLHNLAKALRVLK